MSRPRRLARVLAIAATAAIPAAAATASPVTVGSNFVGNTDCDGITVVKTVAAGHTSFVIPIDGVVTSWSTNAESGGNRMAAVVYRLVGGNYELVGISDTEVPTGSGLKTYSTNIAVRQGDLFGSWVEKRSGGLSVRKTCVGGATGYTTSWWYDAPDNRLPPTATVSLSSIGTTLVGNANDSNWRYDISATVDDAPPAPAPDPVVPSTPGTPSTPATSSTPSAASDPVPQVSAPSTVPRLAGKWTRPSSRGVVRTRGTVPAGATRIVQAARPVRGATTSAFHDVFDMARVNARAGACRISGTAYRCSIRLGAGRWVITTSAVGPAGVVARSTRRVVVRQAFAGLPVTG